MNVPEYHVGCGIAGIYAGTIKPNGKEWKDKTLVTDEAIEAVRDWIVSDCLEGRLDTKKSGGYEWKTKDGKTVLLMIHVKEAGADNA